MIEFNLFPECLCNESRPNQSKDQRIQHDEVGRLWFHLWFSVSHLIRFQLLLIFLYIWMCILNFSAPSSRSEPSPKAARQALSIKQAFLGGKSEGRLHSPHSPKTGEERRALKGKDTSPILLWSGGVFFSPQRRQLCAFSPARWGQSTTRQSRLEAWHRRDHETTLWEKDSSWGHVWSATRWLSTCTDQQGEPRSPLMYQ